MFDVLLIGLGGTGLRVALYLKALCAQLPDLGHRFRILVFDTDHHEPAESWDLLTGKRIALDQNERILIGEVPVARIRRNLGNHPAIAARLPQLPRLPAVTLRDGARQRRPLGLLAFMWHVSEIRKQIHNHLWRLADRQRAEGGRPLWIIVVASLAGGTGAGIFLDMGYLLRAELELLGELAQRAQLILLAVGPDVFHNLQGDYLSANAVASLLELNHWMMKGKFDAEYPDGSRIQMDLPPFDRVYYIGAVDEEGHVWQDRETLLNLLAHAVLILASTPLGARAAGIEANQASEKLSREHNGVGTFLGSLGVASLVFPASTLIELFAVESARGTVDHLLQPGAVSQADLERWIRSRDWTFASLEAAVLRGPGGDPPVIRLDVPGWIEELSDLDGMIQQTRRYLEEYRQLRLETQFRNDLQARAQEWTDRQLRVVWEEAQQIALASGFPAACSFLNGLEAAEVLRQLEEELRQERMNRDLQSRGSRRWLEGALTRLRRPRFPILGRRRMLGRVRQAFRAAEEAYRAQLQQMAAEIIERTLARLREGLKAQARKLQELEEHLRGIRATLQARADRIRQGLLEAPAPLALRVVDQTLLERLAGELKREEGDPLEGLFFRDLQAEDLADRLVEKARPIFDALREKSIEEILEGQEEPLPDRLRKLRQLAQPFWALDEAIWRRDWVLRMELIGVANTSHTRLKDFVGSGTELVPIGDRHRLIVLHIALGAPYSALRQFPQYQRQYNNQRREEVHVFPEFLDGPDALRDHAAA